MDQQNTHTHPLPYTQSHWSYNTHKHAPPTLHTVTLELQNTHILTHAPPTLHPVTLELQNTHIHSHAAFTLHTVTLELQNTHMHRLPYTQSHACLNSFSAYLHIQVCSTSCTFLKTHVPSFTQILVHLHVHIIIYVDWPELYILYLIMTYLACSFARPAHPGHILS